MNVAVIGAGKMGLPLACVFARNGANVIACDNKREVVESINRGASPIDEPGIPELVAEMTRLGRLRASGDTTAAASQCEVIVVIVPVLLNSSKEADTGVIEEVSQQIAHGMKRGAMISYETTLPVGGTRRLLPILEMSGLRGGEDFDLVFSPERVKSRLVLQRLTENPKIVGAISPEAGERAVSFYRTYLGCPVTNVGSLEAAELVKLAGMSYRDVNIALSNELAAYADEIGVDFNAVRRAANTDGEANLLEPGIGVGGHCTPVYPHFLMQGARRAGLQLNMVELGRRINDEQPARQLHRLEKAYGPLRGRRVLILGLGFRPEVKEHVCSPAFQLRDELLRLGANVRLHDPLYTRAEIEALGFTPGSLDETPASALSSIEGPEVIVLNTAHPQYAHLDFAHLARGGLKAVLDGRNLWNAQDARAAGITYIGIGGS